MSQPKVAKAMQAKYDAITQLTDAFAAQYLTEEYAELIRKATATLSRKRPSPIDKGQANTWACGITHAIGMVNFLFDKSQTPSMSAAELYAAFGVAQSTGQQKSKDVRDMLKMNFFSHEWLLSQRVDNSIGVWMISINGFIADVRTMPREVQEAAFEKGLIPYIPADRHGE